MKTWLKKLFTRPTRKCRRVDSRRPMLEALEDRVTPAVTDLTQLALQLGPPPAQAQQLHLNFDGYQGQYDGQNHDIHPFAGSQQDIQDVLYRTSEAYAPFNVQVDRIYGAGNYDTSKGATTVFVGGDQQNLNDGILYPYGHSGLYGLDAPTQLHKDLDGGTDHAPHSNPFNVAYADPTTKVDAQGNKIMDPSQWVNQLDNAHLALVIAHEAGHTFGLGHVESGNIPEMMSYSAPNLFFNNTTFDITTKDFNGKDIIHNDYGLQPVWDGSTIVTQNSFTYLQAEFGARPDDGMAHVAHPGSVDPTAYVAPTDVSGQTSVTGDITSTGDYNVYSYTAGIGQSLVAVQGTSPDGAPTLDAQVLVYNSLGNLVPSASLAAGETYSLVVGAVDGGSVGSYQLSIVHLPDAPPLVAPVGPLDPVAGHVVPGLGADPGLPSPVDVVTNPGIDLGLPPALPAGPDVTAVTPQRSVLNGTDAVISPSQSQLISQSFVLANSDLVGLQQISGQSKTYQPWGTGLAQSQAFNLALQPFSPVQTGSFFLL